MDQFDFENFSIKKELSFGNWLPIPLGNKAL